MIVRDSASGISDSFVRRFELRARWLRALGGLILLVIFLLLGTGAYIFLNAPQIAATDIGASADYARELRITRDSLKEEVGTLEEIRQNYMAQFEVAQRTLIEVMNAEGELNTAQLNLARTEARLKYVEETGRQPRPGAPASLEELQEALRIKESLVAITKSFRDSVQQRLEGGAGSKTDLAIVERALNKAESDREILKSQVENFKAPESPGGDELGRALLGVEDAGVTQLLQTNITRFGTLLVIFFFISVLLPMYRYNIRLAAYYDARADALLMIRGNGEADLERLVTLLTPTVTFDKAPAAAVQQNTEVIKEMVRAAARRE